MTVNLNGVEFRVYWRYDASSEQTECHIRVGKGSAHCARSVARYHKDPANRNKARKYSLDKVLRFVFPESKAARAAFWQAYHEQLGHW